MTPWLLILATIAAWTAAGILAWRTYPRDAIDLTPHMPAWAARKRKR